MTNDASDDTSRDPGSLTRFFSKPWVGVWVGIVGVIVGVIGIAYAVYTREKPELTYFVHPAKAAVVRTGQTSSLAVEFQGKAITSDVTAAQVAFWNAGNKPIRSTAILSPLVIKTGNKEPILEAKLRKTSRDVAKITLDPSRLAKGEVVIGWNILEHNDGGVLQIVYVGGDQVDIQAHAVLEGQAKIVKLEDAVPEEAHMHRKLLLAHALDYLFVVAGIVFVVLTVIVLWLKRLLREKIGRGDWSLLAASWLIIIIAIFKLLVVIPRGPPFGF